MFFDYFGVDEPPEGDPLRAYIAAVARMSLIGAVRRVRQPGSKHDEVTTLEGKEGRDKSTAIEVLFGAENYTDSVVLGGDDRRMREQIRGKWGIEFADLSGKTRAEVNWLKGFVSRKTDRGRDAYARFVTEDARSCVFWATINDAKWLISKTGNRRWLPIKVERRINIAKLIADRDQIWGEAATLEAAGESNRLPEPLWAIAGKEQDARMVADPFDDIIKDLRGTLIKGEERISLKTITAALGYEKAKDMRPGDRDRISQITARYGWREEPRPFKINGHAVRGFSRTPTGHPVKKGYEECGFNYDVLNEGVKALEGILSKLANKRPRKYILDDIQDLGKKPDVEIEIGLMMLEKWARDESEGRHYHLPEGKVWAVELDSDVTNISDGDALILRAAAELLNSMRVRAHEKWESDQEKANRVTMLRSV
jgi:hypothetical protein